MFPHERIKQRNSYFLGFPQERQRMMNSAGCGQSPLQAMNGCLALPVNSWPVSLTAPATGERNNIPSRACCRISSDVITCPDRIAKSHNVARAATVPRFLASRKMPLLHHQQYPHPAIFSPHLRLWQRLLILRVVSFLPSRRNSVCTVRRCTICANRHFRCQPQNQHSHIGEIRG